MQLESITSEEGKQEEEDYYDPIPFANNISNSNNEICLNNSNNRRSRLSVRKNSRFN